MTAIKRWKPLASQTGEELHILLGYVTQPEVNALQLPSDVDKLVMSG